MTAIPQARKRLLANLQGASGLAGVDIYYGFPEVIGVEAILLGGPEPTDTQWIALGQDQRDDFFTLPIAIQVRHPGDTAVDSDDRGDAILTVVYSVLLADPTLNGVLIMPLTPALGPWRNFQGTEGYVTQIELTLRCRSRS